MADMNQTSQGAEFNEAPENIERRNFLSRVGAIVATTAVAIAGLSEETLADEVTPVAADSSEGQIEYRESELGIDYRAIADAPIDAMLSQGEAEWMTNAALSERFRGREELAARFWTRISSLLGEGTINEAYEDALRENTPNMLIAFTTIDPNHPKYFYLQTVGEDFQLDQYLGE